MSPSVIILGNLSKASLKTSWVSQKLDFRLTVWPYFFKDKSLYHKFGKSFQSKLIKRHERRKSWILGKYISLHHAQISIFSAGRLFTVALHYGRPISSRQLRHAIFSSTISSMVAICDVNLSAARNCGQSADHFPANMVILGPGKLCWMVTHGNSASYRWCGWTFGTAIAAQALVVHLFKVPMN